jgi:hypothetical protein
MANNEVIRAWDEWLRDPSHKQGPGALRREFDYETLFCCLGGLCEVVKALAPEGFRNIDWEPVREQGGKWSFDGTTGTLPSSVVRYAGVEYSNPSLVVPSQLIAKATAPGDHIGYEATRSAAALNDNYHFTFEEIADCIRATYPEAFTEEQVEEGSDNG